MDTKQSVGKQGEAAALVFLQNLGYKIVARNYRTVTGEIDIIAQDKAILVFIEVKTRKTQTFGLPYEAVDFRKQAKIRKVALQFLAEKHVECRTLRFDVISILISSPGSCKIEHLIDAF